MKAILMSIQPKWCEKIFSGEMTIKVCKSAPKLETPFKVYVYCTNGRFDITDIDDLTSESVRVVSEGRGKVIGEFMCCAVKKYDIDLGGNYYRISDEDSVQACLDQNWLFEYGNGRDLYGWHISDLKIYDEPKEISEFRKACDFRSNCGVCTRKQYLIEDGFAQFMGCNKRIYRPPSSWCYVEEIRDESVVSVL